MSGLRSGSQCSAVSQDPPTPPRPASMLVSVLLAMFCRLCQLPVAAASGEFKGPSPSQKALLNALLTPTPSFKKRRGHSIGGAPEQRYQSIPVCVTARLPTQAQDVLVRRSWAKYTGYDMGVQVPGVVSGGRGSKDGPLSRSRSFPPTACAGSPSAFYNERERQEARRPGRGVLATWEEAVTRVQSEVMSPCGAKFETRSSERDPMCATMRDRELTVSVHKEACVARTRSTDLPFSPQDAHLSEVSAVRFSPNSSLLATGGADRLILLWNVVGGEGRCPQASSVLSLQTSPSACSLVGKVLVSLCLLTWSSLWAVAR